MITVELTEQEFNDMVLKASNWDTLGMEVEELYLDNSQASLLDVGEAVVRAFGYI